MYSDMSIRTIASCESNMNSASARASSVLPTPVGPRNRKLPIGRFGSCRPARERRSARGDGVDRRVLADHPFVQALLHVHELLALGLQHPADGDAGPARDDLGDVVGVDLLFEEHRALLALGVPLLLLALAFGETSFDLGDLAVAQFRGALQVRLALGAFGLDLELLELLLELA